MGSRGANIIQGANEALAIARSEANPTSFRIHLPPEVDVKAIRIRLTMSQSRFAEAFGLSVRTVQAWKRGRAKPDATGRAYLRVIERCPQVVQQALAPPSLPSGVRAPI